MPSFENIRVKEGLQGVMKDLPGNPEQTDALRRARDQVVFAASFGPLLVMGCVIAASLQGRAFSPAFVFMAAAGLLLCMGAKLRGLLVAHLFLALYLFFTCRSHPFAENIGRIGQVFTLGMAYIVTFLADADLHSFFATLRRETSFLSKENETLTRQIACLKEESQLDQEIARHKLEYMAKEKEQLVLKAALSESVGVQLQQECDRMRQELAVALQQVSAFSKEVQTLQQRPSLEQWQSLEQMRHKLSLDWESAKNALEVALQEKEVFYSESVLLMQKISELSLQNRDMQSALDEKEKQSAINDCCVAQLQKECEELTCSIEEWRTRVKETSIKLASAEQTIEIQQQNLKQFCSRESHSLLEEEKKRWRHQEALLKQLRQQFDEKNQVLHQTRIALFQLENKLFVLQRQEEERLLEEEACPLVYRLLEEMEKDKDALEKQVAALEELVDALI